MLWCRKTSPLQPHRPVAAFGTARQPGNIHTMAPDPRGFMHGRRPAERAEPGIGPLRSCYGVEKRHHCSPTDLLPRLELLGSQVTSIPGRQTRDSSCMGADQPSELSRASDPSDHVMVSKNVTIAAPQTCCRVWNCSAAR